MHIQFSCQLYMSYLQCQMRSTVRFSQLKESMLEVLKQSTQTSDHKIEELDERMRFYRLFYQNKKLQRCQISQIEIVTNSFWYSYAVKNILNQMYTIQIVTCDVLYSIKRRFSEFQQFYHKNKVEYYLGVKLPAKTFFRAGWAEDVTKQRTIQLNLLIDKVLTSENLEMHLALYDFLGVFQHYAQQGLIEKEEETYEPNIFISDQELIGKINKLKGQPTNSLIFFRQIKQCLFERKKKIPYQIAKQFLLGFGSKQGFISFIMKNQNQIVVLEGLQMLVDLLSPQTNKDSELFMKVLSRCTSNQLILVKHDPIQQHSILKIVYFQFLRLYRQACGQEAVRDVIIGYNNQKELHHQYQNWQKLQRLQGRG